MVAASKARLKGEIFGFIRVSTMGVKNEAGGARRRRPPSAGD
jgi:hypothetical protein